MSQLRRIPVTVLTGFLGAGKTTLLNRLLTENHGRRIAVIENEFGEIGIDHELVVRSDEELFEMNNGCICCTVRGDLLRILGRLARRRERFDLVLIETTGLADPGPVIQTFFVDDEVREHFVLDGVVTLVDALHGAERLDDAEEARRQAAFADRILLNKADLVEPAALDLLEGRLRELNRLAEVRRTERAAVPLDWVLGVGGFDLERATAFDPRVLEREYPFEWGAVVRLGPDTRTLRIGQASDRTVRVLLLPVDAETEVSLEQAAEHGARAPRPPGESPSLPSGRPVAADGSWHVLDLGVLPGEWLVSGATDGIVALLLEHHPDELDLRFGSGSNLPPGRLFRPDHEHDERVTSVGLVHEGACDAEKLREWLGQLVRERGPDLFRIKGILSLAGSDRRIVLQGVHMLLESGDAGPWGTRTRRTEIVVIGRDLDRASLRDGFASCRA